MTDNPTIVGNFNTSLSIMDRATRQTAGMETEDANNTILKLDLTDIQRTSIQQQQNARSSQAHRDCSSGLTIC